MTRARVFSSVAGTILVALVFGCDPTAGAPRTVPPTTVDGRVYATVLAEVRKELDLKPPIPVHPYPGRVNQRGPEFGPRIHDFNSVDTLAMTEAIHSSRDYRSCDVTVSGRCRIHGGETAVVLSEVQDLEEDGYGIVVFVEDQRPGMTLEQYYAVRLKRNGTGWDIVQFSAMH